MVKTVRILEREILMGMRLLGVRKVDELTPEMVNGNFRSSQRILETDTAKGREGGLGTRSTEALTGH